MSGPKAILVSVASATACLKEADKRDYVCPIARPHSEMIKYAKQDDVYEIVLQKLQAIAKRAISPSARPESMTRNTRWVQHRHHSIGHMYPVERDGALRAPKYVARRIVRKAKTSR